jgi:amidohydrolase
MIDAPLATGRAGAVDAALVADMVRWRRHLHAHPELSSQELETTRFIADLLESWGLEVQRELPTGAVARVRGPRGGGPTLALRADIDALPVTERSDVDFISTVPGRMHACGHDGHTAMLLAAARVLAAHADNLDGEVRLIFQPAEETIEGGARPLVEKGAMDGVDAVLGLHLWSELPTGTVGVRPGPVLASMDEFRVLVRGAGGHGAQPHRGRDALLTAAYLVTAMQSLVSRRVDPMEPAVVTVGTFRAGTAFNILADQARLTGTVRSLSEDVRSRLAAELEAIVREGASSFGTEADFEYLRGAPVLVNDPGMVDLLAGVAEVIVGAERVTAMKPMMGGDDFAEYARLAPGAYAFVGAAPPGGAFPHHHPAFAIDEAALEIGLRLLLDTTDRFLGAAPAGRD